MFVATKKILAGGWLSHNLASIKVVIYSIHNDVAKAGYADSTMQEAPFSPLEETFERAVQLASSPEGGGTWSLTLIQKGTLYACYKQATLGDCTGKPPSRANVYARQKYTAWMRAKGASREAAMERYIETVAIFAPEFSSY